MKKLLSSILVVMFTLSILCSSTFAATGVGDMFATAIDVTTTSGDITLPLDSATDDDWFYVPNNSSSSFNVSFILTSPSGKNYDLQWVRVNSSGSYYSTGYVYDNGAGATDAIGMTAIANEKLYIRIMPHSSSDFGGVYRFQYIKY